MAARTPRIPRRQFMERCEAKKARQQLRYCIRFELWRHCPVAHCRRRRMCSSEAPHCMRWAYNNFRDYELLLPHQDIAMPTNIGAPERAARQLAPLDICMWNTTADAFAKHLRAQNV